MPHNETRSPTILSRIVRRIIIWIYAWKGWKIEGSLPKSIKKFVIAGAPHTSNWDFVFFAGATHKEQVQPNFMGKHTLFQGMMRNFMFDMGGIPIDRTKKANAVEQVAVVFAQREELALVIACEGTRSSAGRWQSGWENIAQGAGVPIVPAFADNDTMTIGFGPPMIPSGNYAEDLLKLAQWFRSKIPDLERYKVLEAQAKALIAEQIAGNVAKSGAKNT